MRTFSHQMPYDFIDPSWKLGIQPSNIIDPSVSTAERMAKFECNIENSKPAAKAVEKFKEKISNSTKHDCLKNAIQLSANLTTKGPATYPRNHTIYHFQALITKFEFDLTPPGSEKKASIKLENGKTHLLLERSKESRFEGIIDNADTRLISRTDRDADLFLLKLIPEHKSEAQLSDIYQLWDIYSPAISEIINYPKRYFGHKRPDEQEYLDWPPSKSYPGGHATAAAALATLLLVTSGLSNEKELKALCEKLGKAATYIATLREMAGIHYKEDSEEGLKLGFAVMLALLEATINSKQASDLALLLQSACNGPPP